MTRAIAPDCFSPAPTTSMEETSTRTPPRWASRLPASHRGASACIAGCAIGEGERTGEADAPVEAPASSREKELEDEARLLHEEVDALATASGRAEEEFKAYNEELTSMNEELRAANEELDTSKEELQSLNEELSTVNHQLRSKVDELRERTSDLQNLLSSTDVAILFLDNDLNVRWFSPSLETLFHIRQADVQRPVAQLA